LFAKNGKSAALAKKLKIGDTPGKASVTKTFTALPLSPGQWMLVASSGADGTFAQSITKAIGALGYVSEQSDSRVCLSVSGEKARQVMAKGCRLDLHPSVVDTGFCAQTQMAQVGVLIHQSDDQPTYDLFVYSGFAASFWDWLEEASAEFHPNVKIEAN
jgi:sarcosine oxidase subunit gamma